MTTRVEGGLTYTQTFDAENRLISVAVSGQTTQFIYDGDGNLVKKINPNGSKTLYVGGVYEVDKASGGSVTRTVTYYPAGGAMRINSTLYFILKDHLGSASVVTDASGTILGENRYYPFGETRVTTGTIFTDRLFTGQREMAGLGIYHYNARFYSPKLGRFLSADTIVPSYANPQSLNRFSYTVNNPLRYTDPTGHMLTEGDGGGVGGCGGPNQPSCGGGGGGGGGGGSGGGGGNGGGGGSLEDAFYYSPILGGSSSGCNTWILMNGDGNFCHHTTYTPQPICLVHCSQKEQWEYALSFQYPGQSPHDPVVGGDEERHVMGGDFTQWQLFRDKGAITVSIYGQTIINT